MSSMYRGMGATVVAGTAPMPYIQGRMVGGSSPINGAICWRLPRNVYEEWCSDDPSLSAALPWQLVEQLTDEVEDRLGVAPTPPHHLLDEALATCQELGLKAWLDMALDLKLRAQGVDSRTVDRSIDIVAQSVGRNRPDLRPHTAPDGTVTLMFSDMEGFTADDRAAGRPRGARGDPRAQLRSCASSSPHTAATRWSSRATASCSPSAARARRCSAPSPSSAPFRAQRPEAGEPIRVRIGLHTGEVAQGRREVLRSRR